MIKRLRFALTCMVLVLLVSGCLDTTSSNDPVTGSPGTNSGPGVEEGPWQVNLTAQPFYTAGRAVPFDSVMWTGGSCAFFEFTVPGGTTMLEVVLEGSAAGPGTGYMTFMMRPQSGDWLLPGTAIVPLPPGADHFYQELPSERTVMEQEDPVRGPWQVWVWPHGVVAQQTWDLEITLEGTGLAPGIQAIKEGDDFCD